MPTKPVLRCTWPGSDPLYTAYHDEEWGVPEYDSRVLWETLMLEGFQAGLAWIVILRKRESFRKAFKNFDPAKVARFTETDIERLLAGPRHRPLPPPKSKPPSTVPASTWQCTPPATTSRNSSGASSTASPSRTPAPRARPDTAVRGNLESPQKARLQVRWPNHCLRLDAGRRHGQRPRAGLLPAKGSRSAGKEPKITVGIRQRAQNNSWN